MQKMLRSFSVWPLALALLHGAALAHGPAVPSLPTVTGTPKEDTLFRNVRIFDSASGRVSAATDVLVQGKLIARIAPGQAPGPTARIIEGGGRTLMPGLIDAHWHTMFVATPGAEDMEHDPNHLAVAAVPEAANALMRGFTTVRDVGGNAFALKHAIDAGTVPGPRIYPAGAMISVTSGHGDFRAPQDLPRAMGKTSSIYETSGNIAIADSPDEVRLRVREQLMRGAVLIKLTAGGGVASPHSPLDVVTFTPAEIRAAVEAAENWGTYVAVHAYTPEAIEQAIDAGAKVIEHASLMDDKTAALMARKGIWLSTQAFPRELAGVFPPGSVQAQKFQQVFEGTDHTFQLARKHKLKTAFGTDILFSSALAQMQGRILASMTQWYSPSETLVMATATNAKLLQLSGKRNPYPGTLGAVQEGALADLLLVNGDPTQDIGLIARPDQGLAVIMKDGVIYKNMLETARP